MNILIILSALSATVWAELPGPGVEIEGRNESASTPDTSALDFSNTLGRYRNSDTSAGDLSSAIQRYSNAFAASNAPVGNGQQNNSQGWRRVPASFAFGQFDSRRENWQVAGRVKNLPREVQDRLQVSHWTIDSQSRRWQRLEKATPSSQAWAFDRHSGTWYQLTSGSESGDNLDQRENRDWLAEQERTRSAAPSAGPR